MEPSGAKIPTVADLCNDLGYNHLQKPQSDLLDSIRQWRDVCNRYRKTPGKSIKDLTHIGGRFDQDWMSRLFLDNGYGERLWPQIGSARLEYPRDKEALMRKLHQLFFTENLQNRDIHRGGQAPRSSGSYNGHKKPTAKISEVIPESMRGCPCNRKLSVAQDSCKVSSGQSLVPALPNTAISRASLPISQGDANNDERSPGRLSTTVLPAIQTEEPFSDPKSDMAQADHPQKRPQPPREDKDLWEVPTSDSDIEDRPTQKSLVFSFRFNPNHPRFRQTISASSKAHGVAPVANMNRTVASSTALQHEAAQRPTSSRKTTQSQGDDRDLEGQSGDGERQCNPHKKALKRKRNISGKVNTSKKPQKVQNIPQRRSTRTRDVAGTAKPSQNEERRNTRTFSSNAMPLEENPTYDNQKEGSPPKTRSGRNRTSSRRSKVFIDESQHDKHQRTRTDEPWAPLNVSSSDIPSQNAKTSSAKIKPPRAVGFNQAMPELPRQDSGQFDQPYPSPTNTLAGSSTHNTAVALSGPKLRSDPPVVPLPDHSLPHIQDLEMDCVHGPEIIDLEKITRETINLDDHTIKTEDRRQIHQVPRPKLKPEPKPFKIRYFTIVKENHVDTSRRWKDCSLSEMTLSKVVQKITTNGSAKEDISHIDFKLQSITSDSAPPCMLLDVGTDDEDQFRDLKEDFESRIEEDLNKGILTFKIWIKPVVRVVKGQVEPGKVEDLDDIRIEI